jgi:hypothetical protein
VVGRLAVDQPHRLIAAYKVWLGQRLVGVGDLVAECLCDMGFPDVDGPVDDYRSPGVELAQRGKSRSIAKVDSLSPSLNTCPRGRRNVR